MVGAHGEVQVMDWGLAKVLDPSPKRERGEDDDDPLATAAQVTQMDTPECGDSATRTGSVLGTPAYMPPEQAAGEFRQLDARSDVFGLGAMLCQVLTGSPPYAGRNVNEVCLKAMRGELQEAFAQLEACGAEPELVALCKRCLAFHQEDRPADGNAVAAEVGRIRQATEERARRAELERAAALVREAEGRKRRRQLLLAASVVLLTLTGGLGISLWQMQRAIAAEKAEAERAEGERLAKLDAQEKERLAREAAEKERLATELTATRLRQIETINNTVFDIFAEFDIRQVKQGKDPVEYVLAQKLIGAGRKLDETTINDPLVLASLRHRLGMTLLSLGRAAEAIEFLEWSWATRQAKLGPDHPDTLTSMNNLAAGYRDAGKLDLALSLLEETLKLTKAKLGPDHPDTLISMRNLGKAYCDAKQGEKAALLLQEFITRQRKRFPKDDPSFADLLLRCRSSY
jgi:tetratricopeptide (TPR) repeat protein